MLGFALDLYDVLIMPFLMGSIQKSLGISLTQVSSVTSLTLIGSVIGGALFGYLGDRVGRKQALQLTLLMFAPARSHRRLPGTTGLSPFSASSPGSALAENGAPAWCCSTRPGTRNGAGSAAPSFRAARCLAAASASIVGVWATTSFSLEWGWRIALLTGGSPILLMIFIRIFMPESKAWLQFDALRKSGAIETADGKDQYADRDVPGAAASDLDHLPVLDDGLYVLLLRHRRVHADADAENAGRAARNRAQHLRDRFGRRRPVLPRRWARSTTAFGRRFGALLPGLSWAVDGWRPLSLRARKISGQHPAFPDLLDLPRVS